MTFSLKYTPWTDTFRSFWTYYNRVHWR